METIILFAPLVGAIIAGFGWRYIGETAAQYVTTGLLFLAAALSWTVFLTHGPETQQIHILDFIQSGTLDTTWSIRLDRFFSHRLSGTPMYGTNNTGRPLRRITSPGLCSGLNSGSSGSDWPSTSRSA